MVLILTGWRISNLQKAVVVYCAHDAVFAEEILHGFETQTGIKVTTKYDTEATKSLGLVELLLAEKAAPRCDVFWNNELLGTTDLAEKGLLAPHQGPGWERIPKTMKDPEGRWTGFAARLRVQILRTGGEGAAPDLAALNDPASQADLSRAAIAKPLYGTTLTHYTVLWNRWGADAVKAWHRGTRERGLREVNGNGAVKDMVASGICRQGFTDTDDFFAAKDAFLPVTMQPVQLADGATIAIPNTVALIKGARHEIAARLLIDYLLSAETELALAKSKSRQIPLGPVDEAQLPAEVRELRGWAEKSVPLTELGAARAECLAWLKSIYTE